MKRYARHSRVDYDDQWSGEAPVKDDHYLTTEELDRRKFIVGRVVRTEEGWFLEWLERYDDGAVRPD